MKKLLAAFIVLFGFSSFLYANQEERIISFDVIMTLSQDNTAVLEENISVYSAGKKIRRGLYRNIPKKFKFGIFDGHMNFSDISLERNGIKEPFFTEDSSDNIRINFGDDSFLNNGIHNYKLTYKVDNVVGFYDDFDEVYWNVTGNDWEFTIEKATFKLILPADIKVFKEKISTYIGKKGEKGRPAYERSNLFFDSMNALMPKEGMTVAVPFEKGFIKEPSFIKIIFLNIHNFLPLIIVMIIVLAYYIIVKISSKKFNTSTPQYVFGPPEEVDAALAKYIWNMGSVTQEELIVVYISEMLMNGTISIKKTRFNNFILIPNPEAAKTLSNRNYEIYEYMFPNNEPVKLYEYNRSIVKLGNNILKEIKEKSKKYFSKNYKVFLFSLLMFWLFMFSNGFRIGKSPLNILVIESLFLILFFEIGIMIVRHIAFVFKRREIKNTLYFLFSFFVILSGMLKVFSFGVTMSGNASFLSSVIYIISIFILIIATVWFRMSMVKWTQEGIELYNKIKAYKDFLLSRKKTAESLSINDAFGEFSKHMPYAMALGISDQWAEIFKRQLQDAYNSGMMSESGMDVFMRKDGREISVNRVFSRIVRILGKNRSSTSSSSSGGSGSGGGGSSGGGRGGGGGGGR